MQIKDILIKGARKVYRKVAKSEFLLEGYILDRQLANDMISSMIVNDNACMISRFGSGEIGIVCNYIAIHSRKNILKKCWEYISDNSGLPWWDELFFNSMRNNMGIFPERIDILEKFSDRYLSDTPQIDILGSFNYTEKFMPLRPDVKKIHLESLYPFFVERPWTMALSGKKVLVVHPFVFSIQEQYKRHGKIFSNPDIWPEYELITYRTIQSNAGAKVPYTDWFEALKKMEDDISNIDFDIAILGCGAYGLPLAAHIKRMGKKAIHLGGGSQLLFGIKGKRWDNNAYHWKDLPDDYNTNYSSLYNDYWVRAKETETPINSQKVEGACYW